MDKYSEKVLFEALSCILENQKDIMRHLDITKYSRDWGYDDDGTTNMINECNGIAYDIERGLEE